MFRTIEISDPRFEHEGLRCVTVKSAALRGRADVTLFVPEQVRTREDRPVVMLLHGVYGSHWAWALKGGAHRTAARMIETGEIPPMILAMPSDGLWGDGSGYVRQTARHRGGDFERWIAEEVPELLIEMQPAVSAKSPFFIAGLSMGGFGAMRIGAKCWGRFRGISGHSSITQFEQMAQFVEEPLESYGVLPEDRSVFETMLANRDRLPPLRFDCGTSDSLLEANRELHAQLDARGIAHEYAEFSGGHEWAYWEEHLADTLRFFARSLESSL